MKIHSRYLVLLCALSALVAVALLLAAPSAVGSSITASLPPEPESQLQDTLSPNQPAQEPVVFPPDPGWPEYAQREITVDPEPPILGQPTEVCAWVLNTTADPQVATLDFGVADFGIGLGFGPIGTRTIQVPPNAKALACVVWIPRQPGHWCIQAILHLTGFPDQVSQRNIDIWEDLQPGVPALTVFPVRNSTGAPTTIELSPTNILSGWVAFLTPPVLTVMGVDETRQVTLTVVPPQGAVLGSQQPIVDVEARSDGGLGPLIGGFRKLDMPPVPLHRLKDPPYAETEISVNPYPTLPGEPTQICVDLRNLSDVTQTVKAGFMVADFGIGLPFAGIGEQEVEIPPFGNAMACVTWIPTHPGHFCVHVNLDDPGGHYAHQWSQRNLDVGEILKPGEPAQLAFDVGNWPSPTNPDPITTTIFLTTTYCDSFFDVFLSTYELRDMKPNESRTVTLTVIPGPGQMPDDGTIVADVEAYLNAPPPQGTLLGGFRKIFHPPVPIHIPQEPPYSESEISVSPYPPRAGEPVMICTELRNPTPVTQTVHVEFGVVNFGIGLPFTPIDLQEVQIPPFGKIKVCTQWVPPIAGHFCTQIIIRQEGYQDIVSQRNMDVAEYLQPGSTDSYPFPVGNPFDRPITVSLGLVPHLPGWQASLSDVMFGLAPYAQQVVTLTVTPPSDLTNLADETPVLDVEAYYRDDTHEWTLLGGFRKVFRPPIPIHHPEDPPYAEREISIEPYPPRAGEPTEICVELRNPTDYEQTIWVEFAWADFGIGLPWHPFHGQLITLPPHSLIKKCTTWVPPFAGHFCAQVSLIDPDQRYAVVRSQRNMDVGEVFERGQWTKPYVFSVGNPFEDVANIELSAFVHLPGWDVQLDPRVLTGVAPGDTRPVTLTVHVPEQGPLPPDDTPVVDVEAHTIGQSPNDPLGGRLIGGFRKLYRPPVPIHRPQDPVYAESEIHINPYPPREREPTEICVDVRNPTDVTQTITVTFAVADFGIGLSFHDIARPIAVTLPPNSIKQVCITWVPPFGGHFCARVTLQMGDHEPVWSQRNMDVGEILIPGEPSYRQFLVGNPTTGTVTVTLGLVPHLEWSFSLSQDVLPNMLAYETRVVTLTVTRPLDAPEPEDGAPVVDVEGYIGRDLLGGFRKIYHPPVPIHRPQDPIYAESEIHINPYPPREREPTEICADVRNPTDMTQTITVTFAVANFGIGLPFHDIVRPITVTLPPNSIKQVCVTWVPPFGGHFCAQVTIQLGNHQPVWSQRNMDVGEILIPGVPSLRPFLVGNPTTDTVTVTLGLVPHLDGWQIGLSQDVLPNMLAYETRMVTLTVTPPRNAPEPEDGAPVVDVEGFIGGELIGGFRKIYHPPVPIHQPKDPVYAESEIFVDPYPTRPGWPTLLGAVVFNPTPATQFVTVTFEVANFGIGLPFSTAGIMTPTMVLKIPPFGASQAKTIWIPPFGGHFCVQVILQSPGHEPVRSQRNIDIGEPLKLGEPHARSIIVGNPLTEAVTITLALVNHRPNWMAVVWPEVLPDMAPGMTRTVVLTVTPPLPPVGPDRERELLSLADERPIVDLEAYVNGELIGGIRKIAKPPIPLHKPQDRPYAETEIGVTPYPLVASKPSTITTDIVNTSETTQTVRVLFGVANFGFGIPFTTTGIVPTSTVVTLGPGISTTVWTVWTPPASGHWCIQVLLQDPNNQYPEQRSQRNVDVERRSFIPCQPFTKDFLLQNATPLTVTVSIGASAINLPAGWTYSTNITETVMGPFTSITVTVTITPPCGLAALSSLTAMDTGGASGPPTIDVEGYDDSGNLLGGIEIQLEGPLLNMVYLPIVLKQQ
jgi:hypothetical protein